MADEPIFDETVAEAQPDQENHDDEDVKAALDCDTQDGSGFKDVHELPKSNFESFPEQNVEKEV